MSTEGVLDGLRVAILVQNLPVPFDRRVWQEATSLQQAGADVTVICPNDEKHLEGTFRIEGVQVVRYRNPAEASGPLGYLKEYGVSLWRMTRALRATRGDQPYEIVHFCNPPDLLFLAAHKEKRKYGSTAVFDQHDLGPELVSAKNMPLKSVFEFIARWAERRTYRFADHVIATNESYRTVAMKRGGFGPEDVTVIRSGPAANWGEFEPNGMDYRHGRKYLVGYLGVMGRQEGIDYLLFAIKDLIGRGLDCQLALVGSGPDRQRLEGLATELGIADHVTFFGRVSDDDLKNILASSDVCVNPDEVNPMNDLSTMNKIIEYMALGRPIVQFDVREGRYSAQDASLYAAANDVVDFANMIASLLENPAMARQMGDAGKVRFRETLNWEKQGAKLVNLFARLRQVDKHSESAAEMGVKNAG